jgi:hypothetical protein
MQLLTREEFDRQIKARSGGRCVFCPLPAVDAHHILERKLWPDGGYYVENGAAVCESHHWAAETTVLSVEEVRRAAGITEVLLPPGLSAGQRYDKWGNLVRPDGLREAGPLFDDTGCRKTLRYAGLLGTFVPAGTPLCQA